MKQTIKIGNGGAGIVGFVEYMYTKFNEVNNTDYNFEWHKSDTEETLKALTGGSIPIGWPYAIDRVCDAYKENSDAWSAPSYIFRDHFALVGPKSNTANLPILGGNHPHASNDEVYDMFKTISEGKNGTVFLTRDDLSATNVLERDIFKHVMGRYPDTSKDAWYKPLTGDKHYPDTTLEVSNTEGYYTLSDRGIWTWADADKKTNLQIYCEAGDTNPDDILLNACLCVILKNASSEAQEFFTWLSNDGQNYIEDYKLHGDRLFSKAPENNTTPCENC